MAVNHAKNRQSMKKSYDALHNRNHEAFREVKTKSYYPFGRKTGIDNIVTDAYREAWDRIFGKKDEPGDFDSK